MVNQLVTVIIPTYNRRHTVLDAIRSVRNQTWTDIQIIVVDDGSTDDTADLLSSIDGIEYVRQTNQGQGAARNAGLSKAKGVYIASLDSDDVWDADFLETSIECLETFDLDFVFSNWHKLRGNELIASEWLEHEKWRPFVADPGLEWHQLSSAQCRKLFLDLCPAPSSSVVIRRNAIVSGWGDRMRIADDWFLLLEAVLQHPCRAAFTLVPRWVKRVDGSNVYDGRPAIETLTNLYLHDQPLFRRDFAGFLTLREKFRLSVNEWKYRIFLFSKSVLASNFSSRWRIPVMMTPIRLVVRRLID